MYRVFISLQDQDHAVFLHFYGTGSFLFLLLLLLWLLLKLLTILPCSRFSSVISVLVVAVSVEVVISTFVDVSVPIIISFVVIVSRRTDRHSYRYARSHLRMERSFTVYQCLSALRCLFNLQNRETVHQGIHPFLTDSKRRMCHSAIFLFEGNHLRSTQPMRHFLSPFCHLFLILIRLMLIQGFVQDFGVVNKELSKFFVR